MTVKIILISLALLSIAISLVHSKNAFWDGGVFPDDPKGLADWNGRKFESFEKNTEAKETKSCETPECKRVAEQILGSMNKSMDPCEDFYEFSCGGWIPDDRIPPYMAEWSNFMVFQTAVQYRVKAALEIKPEPNDILPVRQAKKWYRSCMDLETLERRGVKPIESILSQAGGWPISMDKEEWDAEEYNWQKVESVYARLTGTNIFYKVQGRNRGDDPSSSSIIVFPQDIPLSGQLPLKYRNYTGNDYETYVNLVEKTANFFVQHNRADVSKAEVRKEAEEIVEFEKKLYKLSSDAAGSRHMSFEKLIEWNENITESVSANAKIDWESSLQGLFDLVNIDIPRSSKIYMYDSEYFEEISKLLNETSPRTIVNYIHWRFVGEMLTYTTEHMREELFALVKEEYGVKQRAPRWSECVNEMKMTHAAAYAFVNKFFTDTTKIPAQQMIDNIRAALEEKIDNSNWLDAEGKEASKDKLNGLEIFIGFPDWYKNKTAVTNHYKGLTIGAEYFDNCLSYIRYENKQKLKSFAVSDDTDDPWAMDPITVNAMYDPFGNQITVPAVDFQSPLFTTTVPQYVNYGITGVIIGHEMGHAFDDDSIQMNGEGSETDLSDDMMKAYYQRADCFLDQFEGYYGETAPPKSEGPTEIYDWMQYRRHSKGKMTRPENIADTTGIQAVFEAYKKQIKPGGDVRLPGLEEYTDEQLFFLSFGATWCQVATPQYEKKIKERQDVHSPAKYRVIGAVSNSKDFAKVFDCPIGSSMNPENKCNIWKKPGAAPKVKPPCDEGNNYRWGGQWRY